MTVGRITAKQRTPAKRIFVSHSKSQGTMKPVVPLRKEKAKKQPGHTCHS
jgi:hypothetical protein